MGGLAVDSDAARREDAGRKAEHVVFQRLRTALPEEYRLYPNVAWLGRTAARRGLRDGEADIVLAHPERGFLVIEVKSGRLARDAAGKWLQNGRPMEVSPFEQARTSMHQLLDKLRELPAAPPRWNPIAGHAVAFPDVDIDSARVDPRLLGPDVERELILDRQALGAGTPERTRAAIDGALDLWSGEGGARTAPGAKGIELLDAILTTPVELTSMLRSEIDEGEREVVELTRGQLHVLRDLRRIRRAEIRGGAGTGKTLLALEKARQLAREGFRTLLVCFNQPLARMLRDEVGENEYLHVSTFHQLCEDLGREAGTLPQKPDPPPQDWWDLTLPTALLGAIDRLGARYHAIVVDEGQDFAADWLEGLELLLMEPKTDVFYVFHDPAQSLYREDVVEGLGLTAHDLDLNCRNSQPIHALVARFAEGALAPEALREGGRPPEVIVAETPPEAIEALRGLLHRLRHDEKVRPWEIAVLTGASLEKSDVWRQRTFGNEVLWNGQVDGVGRPTGRSANQVEPQPDDVILCDSIRRFKGLERPVIVLVELDAHDKRLERLLYVGISRARQHVALIVPSAVACRL
ncbi:MAG: NERD domain-containing protein [Chloroflexota bacterium]